MNKTLIVLITVCLAALCLHGPTAFASGRQDPAALDAQVAQDPENVALRVAAGKAWLKAAQAGAGDAVGQAEQHLDRALELAPDDPQILVLHGSMLVLKGRDATLPVMKMRHVTQGMKEMDRAVELVPMDFGIRYQRGVYCLRLPEIFERGSTAVEDFSHLLMMAEQAPERVSPEELAGIKLNLAKAQIMTGAHDEARSLLESLIATAPDTLVAEESRDLLAQIDD